MVVRQNIPVTLYNAWFKKQAFFSPIGDMPVRQSEPQAAFRHTVIHLRDWRPEELRDEKWRVAGRELLAVFDPFDIKLFSFFQKYSAEFKILNVGVAQRYPE